MEQEDIARMRAKIIERFLNIERFIEIIITQHYFNLVKINFLLEVLYDEYFSFGLKVNILSKILEEKETVNQLRRLGSIRNTFVHAAMTLREYVDKNNHSAGMITRNPNPKKIEHDLDYQTLYDEFLSLDSIIWTVLLEEYKNKGGTMFSQSEMEAI